MPNLSSISDGKYDKKYPQRFNYEVDVFAANTVDEMNQYLIGEGLDATDIISITHNITINLFVVFFKRKVS